MKTRIDFICEATAGVGTILQPNEILRIVSMALTCLSVCVSLCFTLYKWHKEAKKDGKIDNKEIDEAINIVKDHVEVINNNVDNFVEKSKKDGDANG